MKSLKTVEHLKITTFTYSARYSYTCSYVRTYIYTLYIYTVYICISYNTGKSALPDIYA